MKPVFPYRDVQLDAAKESSRTNKNDHAGPEGLLQPSRPSSDAVSHSITYHSAQDDPPLEAVQLIIQFGNQPTHALRYQAQELGENCRNEYLLLNPEILDEVHI